MIYNLEPSDDVSNTLKHPSKGIRHKTLMPCFLPTTKGNLAGNEEYNPMPYTTDTIQLLDSIKTLIECNVLGIQTTSTTIGLDTITVGSTLAYADGDYILLYDDDATAETPAYEHQVMANSDTELWINPASTTSIENAKIIKRINNSYCKSIYIGNPPTTPDFPCIVINGEVIDDEPLALAGTSTATYGVTVSVFTNSPDYDTANRTAWSYAKLIEQALTMQINPTVCMAIWKQKFGGIKEDAQNNQNSTTKAIHLTMYYDEVLQRLTREIPIRQWMNQSLIQ